MKSPGIPIVVFLAIASLSFAESKKHSSPPEQTVFSAEDETVKRPVSIPTDMKALLSRDKVVQVQLENANKRAEELPSSWFSASEIHLGTGRKPDVIIVANSPVAGANTTVFWIFNGNSRKPDLLLNTQAHTLTVMKARWKGFREIMVSGVTLQQSYSILFRFDGTGYRKTSEILK